MADFEQAFSFDKDNLELLTDAYVEMQAAGFGEQGQTYLEEFMAEKGKSCQRVSAAFCIIIWGL